MKEARFEVDVKPLESFGEFSASVCKHRRSQVQFDPA